MIRFSFVILSILGVVSLVSGARADEVQVFGSPPLEFSSDDIAGRACLARVNEARTWTRDILGDRIPWLNQPIICEVAADTGCGSAMYGNELQFLTGDKGCTRAVLISEYVYHEWAHGLNRELAGIIRGDLDEAMADVFAVYMTGDSRFGKGMYFEREHSWPRDISERKIYDGLTKQLYTQSETLSGVWWDFRERLSKTLGVTTGTRLAREVFLWHLKLMGQGVLGSPELTRDSAYALAAVEDLGNPLARCALVNSYLDHGFKLVSDCLREHLPSGDELVLAAALAPSPLFSAEASAVFPMEIPDAQTLTLKFEVKAPAKARARGLVLKTKIAHPLSDDLLIRVTAPDGFHHDIYKGEEELAVPNEITDRFLFDGRPVNGTWKVEIVNFGTGLHGVIHAMGLSVIGK
ncbi:hypothetical protein WDW37_02660 [Bdellovibrionota bacterium FG-1]